MKKYLFLTLLLSSINLVAAKTNTYIYLHGLNSNIKSAAYHPFFTNLESKGKLEKLTLPGHHQKSKLDQMNIASIKKYLKKLAQRLDNQYELKNVVLIAHSMSALLIKNHLPKKTRINFKSIYYLAPSAPPKGYAFFKLIIKFLPNFLEISSYSPAALRLNNSVPVGLYAILFEEVKYFLQNNELLNNEKIIIHEADEAINVKKLKSHYPSAEVISTTTSLPKHVFFLDQFNLFEY